MSYDAIAIKMIELRARLARLETSLAQRDEAILAFYSGRASADPCAWLGVQVLRRRFGVDERAAQMRMYEVRPWQVSGNSGQAQRLRRDQPAPR